MNELLKSKGRREVERFDPERHRLKIAALDYSIEEAKRIKDWPALEEAVDLKIEEQCKFVAWWKATVQRAGGDRQSQKALSGIADNALSAERAKQLTGMSPQRVHELSGRLIEVEEYRAFLLGIAYCAAMLEARVGSQRIQQSLSPEHYTPAKYIEAARQVLSEIDLDPASCAEANETVRATEIFDAATDGLAQPWRGRVWLNPPYGDLVGPFIAKLIDELNAKNVTSAIALVNAHCTDTIWFKPLWGGLLCFTDHRINFSGDAKRSGSTHGSVFVYFGQNREKFIETFSQFGPVVERVVYDD